MLKLNATSSRLAARWETCSPGGAQLLLEGLEQLLFGTLVFLKEPGEFLEAASCVLVGRPLHAFGDRIEEAPEVSVGVYEEP